METGNKITTGETVKQNFKILIIIITALSLVTFIITSDTSNKINDQITYNSIQGVK